MVYGCRCIPLLGGLRLQEIAFFVTDSFLVQLRKCQIVVISEAIEFNQERIQLRLCVLAHFSSAVGLGSVRHIGKPTSVF